MFQLLATSPGRIVRIVAGLDIFLFGLLYLAGIPAILVMILGFAPIMEGILNFSVFAPLFGQPLSGWEVHGHR